MSTALKLALKLAARYMSLSLIILSNAGPI